MTTHIAVSGNPAPKGSVHAYAAKNKAGHYTGNVGLRQDATSYPAWNEAVRSEGQRKMAGAAPLTGALAAAVTIRFARPKSHYRTGKFSQQLRPDAPVWPIEGRASKDIDKLLRAIFDGLKQGGVIGDDSQIPLVGPLMRVYCEPGETPGADIWINKAPIKPPRFELTSPRPEVSR
jgi:Holliday junction resolvase RusA-like endonuclease